MDTSLAQPGILAAPAPLGLALSFRLTPADPRAALIRLQEGFRPEWGVVGLGDPLIAALGATVPGLRAFPALSGAGVQIPATQQAVWVMLRADDRGALFDRSQAVQTWLAPEVELNDALDTFIYSGGRDLTGYEDGTENPDAEAAPDVALANGQQGLAGSSFVAVQRWAHDLAEFQRHSPTERDNMIGRRREDNEELEDAPASAHVKRSAQESFSPEAFMLRRSMPWATARAQGLEFIAYGHSLDAFEVMLKRMAGLEDGIVDALFRFSRPLTGSYFWCPPCHDERLDLRQLGL